MHLVLAGAIALLLVAVAGSVALLRRTGDPRAALLAATFCGLAAVAALALGGIGRAPLGFDVASLAALAALAASAVCPLVVVSLGRTLRERDSTESLHWTSMETVRALADLSASAAPDPAARLARLLEIGCEHFDLEVGIAARVQDDRYEVLAVRAPRDFPVKRGDVLPLAETWCRHAAAAPRPVDVADVAASGFDHAALRARFPIGCYLGTAVRVGGEVRGTLAFAGIRPRPERFTATAKDLLTLMARWLATETDLELRPAPRPAAAPEATTDPGPARPSTDAAPAPDTAPRKLAGGWQRRALTAPDDTPRVVDVNAALGRLERRLARAAGRGVEVSVSPGPDLEIAREPRLPLESIVLSLVAHARVALRGGGRLVLETANLEVPRAAPDVVPDTAPDRYVTLRLRVQGRRDGIDTDALSRAFESSDPSLDGRHPIPLLYRMLQHCGGDLSIDVERGVSACFTVYLPRAADAVRPAAAPAAGTSDLQVG